MRRDEMIKQGGVDKWLVAGEQYDRGDFTVRGEVAYSSTNGGTNSALRRSVLDDCGFRAAKLTSDLFVRSLIGSEHDCYGTAPCRQRRIDHSADQAFSSEWQELFGLAKAL